MFDKNCKKSLTDGNDQKLGTDNMSCILIRFKDAKKIAKEAELLQKKQ